MRRINQGPPWRRHDGSVVPHGAQFEATHREEQIIAQYGWGSTFPPAGDAPVSPAAAVAAPAPARAAPAPDPERVKNAIRDAEAAALRAQWPLKTDPAVYLQRYPDGQHAELARKIAELPAEAEAGAVG